MAYDSVIYAGSILNIEKMAASSLPILNPLLAQIDFSLFGSIGLSGIQADAKAQLSAALAAAVDLRIGITNPFESFSRALAAIPLLLSEILRALSGALPVVSIDASLRLSAMASLAASLSARIGGFEAVIQGGIAAKIPAINWAKILGDLLDAGPLFVISFSDDGGFPPLTLASAGARIGADFTAGLHWPLVGPVTDFILPTDRVYGVVFVTKVGTVWTALQQMVLTA
jgi:hypothetical protein